MKQVLKCELFDSDPNVSLEDEFKLNNITETNLIIVIDPKLIKLQIFNISLDNNIETIENSYHFQYEVSIYNVILPKKQLNILNKVHTLTLIGCHNVVDVSRTGFTRT